MADLREPVECFNESKEMIVAIATDKIVNNNMPYDEAMQEGRRVEALVKKFFNELAKSDIDQQFLTSIATRAGAFAYCVAVMDSYVKINQNDSEKYLLLKKEGYKVRSKILKILEYVFRNDPSLLLTLATIREGRGDLDMIRDNLSVFKLGENYRDRLLKANVDFSLFEQANSLYKELFNLTAQLDIDPKMVNESKVLCAKAWTYLWQALTEIYQAGRIVFMDQPEIEELFYIDYRQEIAKMKPAEDDSKKAVKEEEMVTA